MMTTVRMVPWVRRAGAAASVLVLYRMATLFTSAWRGNRIAGGSRPFERALPACRARVLVIGDSTGVGAGASCAEESIAGLLAREFPDVAICNRARSGAKAADAVRQLATLAAGRFDVVFVHVGANDILRATPLPQLAIDIAAVLRAARERSETVIFMSAPNMGLCPAFFPPFSWLLTMRTRQARDLFLQASAAEGVTYIDIFRERGEDVFSNDPARYFAEDRLHPTSASYDTAYRAICEGSALRNVLQAVS